MRKNFERCDVSKIGRKRGCKQIGTYDGDSVMHYHPVFTTQIIENGKYVDKEFRMANNSQQDSNFGLDTNYFESACLWGHANINFRMHQVYSFDIVSKIK